MHGALLAARPAGHTHVHLDGTLIRIDRSQAVGPTPGWTVVVGKAPAHGGNIQVVTAPDGWPLWASPYGQDVSTTPPARSHPGLLDALTEWTDSHAVLTDLGYEGENTRLTCPIKNSRGRVLTAEQRTINALHSATRALAERGNSLLKTTFKGLRRVTLCPWRIGGIAPPRSSSCTTSTGALT